MRGEEERETRKWIISRLNDMPAVTTPRARGWGEGGRPRLLRDRLSSQKISRAIKPPLATTQADSSFGRVDIRTAIMVVSDVISDASRERKFVLSFEIQIIIFWGKKFL